MPTLVTGATGFLGNNVVRLLLARGAEVRVLVRSGSDPRPLVGLPVERVEGDIRDRDAVSRAVAGAALVIHAAGLVQVGLKDRGHHAVNVLGTRNVAEACRASGGRLVHISSVDALGWGSRETPAHEETPPAGVGSRLPYSATKRAGEEVVLGEVPLGLDAVVVNPAYLLGPWDWKPSSGRMLLGVARGMALLAPPGGNDFCHVEDVTAGVLKAAAMGIRGRRYILGGEPLSYREAWSLFADVTGARAPVGTAPPWVVGAAGWAGTVWGALTGKEPDVNRGSATISTLPHHFSSRRAEEELGYRNRGAREAAGDAWAWFQIHGYT